MDQKIPLFIGTAAAIAVIAWLVIPVGLLFLKRRNHRLREIWLEKQSRRGHKKLEKTEGRKSKGLKTILVHQMHEINEVQKTHGKFTRNGFEDLPQSTESSTDTSNSTKRR